MYLFWYWSSIVFAFVLVLRTVCITDLWGYTEIAPSFDSAADEKNNKLLAQSVGIWSMCLVTRLLCFAQQWLDQSSQFV